MTTTNELGHTPHSPRSGWAWLLVGGAGLLVAFGGLASTLVSATERTAAAQERLTAAHERVAAVEEASAALQRASMQTASWVGSVTTHALSTPIVEASITEDLDRHARILAAAQRRFPPGG